MSQQATPAPALFADRSFVSAETYDAFFTLLSRIEAVIDEETALLAVHRHDKLAELTRQKRHGLLELNRMMQGLSTTIPSQSIIARLAAFRTKLTANNAALQIELRAAEEVNDIIVRVMREQESDGTYSRAFARADYDTE